MSGKYIRYYQNNELRTCAPFVALLAPGLVMLNLSMATAQTLTPNPGAWRPMAYANLQKVSPVTATYAEIWRDLIELNNRAYRAQGDTRFADGNAPATEAHFVIWSRQRSVVLSILNTARDCSRKTADPVAHVTIKLCPMRLAVYEGIELRTMNAGRGCVLETDGVLRFDAGSSGAYASYDIPTKTVKTGLIVNHAAVDGCSFNVPLERH